MDLFDVYSLYDVEPVKAQGTFIWDKNGDRYLDLYGGHAVISIGHSHPYYVKKVADQLQRIAFYSNSVIISQQLELAGKLGALSGYNDYNLFLCNSGAEANENALKIASFVTGRRKVIAIEGSFHGRTSAAVEATDDKNIRSSLNMNENVVFVPMNDEDALTEAFETNSVCAVIIEGIQGVGGIRVPDASFLKKIKMLTEESSAFMIVDEIQSGFGRTGKFFAHQHAGVQPDIITVAKGMGNGFPVAGVLINPSVEAKQGMLGTTFGGNHLACAASIAVLDIIKNEKLIRNAELMGLYLKAILPEIDGVKEVRGEGLMIGIEMDFDVTSLRKRLIYKHKIFTGSSSDKNVIRLLPALNISEDEIQILMKAMKLEVSKTPISA